ncbi:MAG: 50S ribosomal protein L33 [Alphaproteobacteria bacterium]|nr:50S ribosomal protein L33 [Alphaproteobacteria bacterium]MBL0717691.1 50S ribosomal protein L33 [Alphaproteobacteria bacterium]
MAKKTTIVVKLENKDTGEYYTIRKNPKSEATKGKMSFRKYDKKLRKHAIFTEAKMPN